jgi:DNA-binding NarL/FixJ family response regulator
MTDRKRLLLADDHPVVLLGLRSLVETQNDLEVVSTATNGLVALKLIRETALDLAIIDISMPTLSGLGLLHRALENGITTRFLMFSLHEDRAHVNHALRAGARGYMLKRTASETAIPAIRAVLAGGIYIDPAIAGHALHHNSTARHPINSDRHVPDLTDREESVLKLAAKGYSNKEIAGRLAVGIKSVETYKTRGMDKLGLKTRVELIRFAITRDWLADV